MARMEDVLHSPAAAALCGLEDAGLNLAVVGGRLRVSPVERLTVEHERVIRRHRDELVALVRICDEDVQERLVAFKKQLKEVPAATAPDFGYKRGTPRAGTACSSCGAPLPEAHDRCCWRCSLAWRMAVGEPVPAEAAPARSGAQEGMVADSLQVQEPLDSKVRWRVDVLQPQVPLFPAPIPHLTARPDARPGPGDCVCCGDPLAAVPDIGVGQCHACGQAISLLIAETRREYERSTLESQGRAIAGMVVPEADRPKESSAPLEATCRWCNGPITDRRRTWFCSDDCRKHEGRVHRVARASRTVSLAPVKARPRDMEPGTSS